MMPSVRGHAATRHLGLLAIDLQVFETVVILFYAHGAIAILGLQIAFPKVGCLENVSVGVDHTRHG